MSQNLKQKGNSNQILCIELLNTFTDAELENLKKFISCGYHNGDKSLLLLLPFLMKKVLNKAAFEFELQRIAYEKIFSITVKRRDFGKKEKRKLFDKLNKLTRLAEKFLTYEALQEHNGYFNDLLFKKLKDKKQHILFLRHANRNKKQLNAVQVKDKNYYYQSYINYYHILQYQHKEGLLYEDKEYELDKINYNLDVHYILKKLDFDQTRLAIEDTTKKKFDVSTIEAISALLNLSQYKQNKYISISQSAIALLKKESTQNYRNLLDLVSTNSSLIFKDDLIKFYVFLTNYCLKQIKKGIDKYKELFELYKLMDNQHLIVEVDFIPILKLKNIIIVSCRNEEFIWAEEILNKYLPYVRYTVRESVYNLNRALIAFYQKDYEKSLKFAVRVEDNVNVFFDKSSRILILKCHYELDIEFDYRTERILRSAKKFFTSIKTFDKTKKLMYANFMNIFINLYKLKHNVGKTTLEQIRHRLDAQKVNSDKYWLMNKIEELE